MPLPLSADLRWRVIMLYFYRDYSVSEIADLIIITTKSVNRILNKFYNTGDVQPTEQSHGPDCKLDAFAEMVLLQYLMENPSAYLDELQHELDNCIGVVCILSTICRTLSRLGLAQKKLQCTLLKRSEDSRCEFREEINCIYANMIVWIDETGTNRRDANRCCGYHLRGTTPVSHTLSIRGR